MSSAAHRVAGAVLAGGASRRMGTDKAMLTVEGTPLVERAAVALRAAGVREVLVIGGSDAVATIAERVGARHCPDLLPGAGPLAGLVTALEALPAGADALLLVACDHPDLDPGSLARLADTLLGTPGALAAVPTARADAPLDVLHAAYRPTLLGFLRSALDGGERSIRALLGAVPLVQVDVATSSLVDLDTPADVERRTRSGPPHGLRSGAMDEATPSVDVAELRSLLAAGPVTLIDVREPDEHREARVPGVRLVPLQTVPDALPSIPTDGPVYVICAVGGRSLRAAQFLRANGVDAVNVAGGTNAWIKAGFDVESGPVS